VRSKFRLRTSDLGRRPSASKYATPVIRPRSSAIICLAMHSERNSQLPVSIARGITVFCVPHLAWTSQAKPTHQRHRMQAPRPLYGTELRSLGISNGWSPKRFAAGLRISCSRVGGSGGMGRGRLRGARKMLLESSPETPISHSAFS